MFRLTRRAFVAAVALLVPAVRIVAARPAVAPTSLDDFVALSMRLLDVARLDRDVAKIYLDALNADASNAPTLAYLVESNANPTPEMRALSATIIEWWYTGIYAVNGKPVVATHTGALIWAAMNLSAPGTCAGPFGAWSRPRATV